MKALVIYESMYGNTHLVANAIAEGLQSRECEATVVPVDEADTARLEGADLVVVGGPTHAHGMSRPSTRESAVAAAAKPGTELVLDPDAEGPGLREWFDGIGKVFGDVAAFDTRADIAAVLSGRASKGIARRLRQHGAELVCDPESFFVTKDNHLEPMEAERARNWGANLAFVLGTAGRKV